ncbi:peptidoglycan-binding protein [Methyloceanibacter stevinii]|uniref:Peptidoglycan-binding protein n=1 Tax=Methyloceanibacter stevinii TaxID=1774970 RepID=A0A1E3VJV5_9HYPH|nr:peptidoglycan-binding protein [Methyloceanibacter stevinii]ODR93794.1 peptidoglycan-binding protein [Methyloceanibacter stevinii]
MIPIDGQLMYDVAPRFSGARARRQKEIIDEISPVLASTLDEYDINNRLRIAHFIGQTCHEAAGFRTTEEFASGEAYEGRLDLGNDKKRDGPKYKGRGLIQLTGKFNYRKFGKALGIDLESDPYQAAEPRLSLRIACEYWKDRKINPDCDRDDIITVTRKINGGLRGLEDRRHYTAKAKAAVARIEGFIIAGGNPDKRPVLHRGSVGEAVGDLQEQLHELGYPLAIDGDFGPATELAVMEFQSAHRLKADGIVGKKTWTALERTAKKKAA